MEKPEKPEESEKSEKLQKFETTPSGLKMYDYGRHNDWYKVSVHTAKCDKCQKHNTHTFQRCNRCNKQYCRDCIVRCHEDNEHAQVDINKLDWDPAPSRARGGRPKARKTPNESSPKTPTPKKDRAQPISGGKSPSKVAKSSPTRAPRGSADRISRMAPVFENDHEDFEYYADNGDQYPYYEDTSIHYDENENSHQEPYRPAPDRVSSYRIRKRPGTSMREQSRAAQNMAERIRRNIEDPGRLPPPDYAYSSRLHPSMNDPYYRNNDSRQEYSDDQGYSIPYGARNRDMLYAGTPFATYAPYQPVPVVPYASQYRSYAPEGTYDMAPMPPRYVSNTNNGFSREQDSARPGSANSAEGYAAPRQLAYSPSRTKQFSNGHRVSFALEDDDTAQRVGPGPSALSIVESLITPEDQARIDELKNKYSWSEPLLKLLNEGKLQEAEQSIAAALSLMNQVKEN